MLAPPQTKPEETKTEASPRQSPVALGAPSGLPLFLLGRAQTKLAGDDAPPATPPVKQTDLGPGEPLDASTLAFFEPKFGRDLSDVRVHTRPPAAAAARSIGAVAFTAGNDIAFDQGRFDPVSTAGRTLLAHELAHVVQQSDSSAKVQAFGAGYDDAEAEADRAASQAVEGSAVSNLSPVGHPLQRQPTPEPVTFRYEKVLTVVSIFRGNTVIIELTLDDTSAARFDADSSLETRLGDYLVALFNPPQGPLPETKRFLSGPRVRALIEHDIPTWLNGGELQSLVNLLYARAEALRKQRVRASLEASLGVDPGTVDWNAELPSLRTALTTRVPENTGQESSVDRVSMFLDMLENEVAGQPPVDGAVTLPDMADRVFKYATQAAAYNDDVKKLFAEKFLVDYLTAIAGIHFIPEGFDLARFTPSGADIAEERRDSLIDEFIYDEADGLATKYLLDRWTTSGVDPETYLKAMDLEKEQEAIIDYLTDQFMRRAVTDPNLAASIREMAADKARYNLLADLVQIGRVNESFNQTLPAIADLAERDLDDQQIAIVHDPNSYYETSWYLAEAIRTILSQVTAGANVGVATLENAQAIAGRAEIPKNMATFAFLLEIGVGINNLKRTLIEQRSVARKRFAGRMRLSWPKIAETIRNFAKEADEFIEKKWIPMVKIVAQDRIHQNYADIKKWYDNFGGETPNVIGRYRLAAYSLEDVANALESGEHATAEINGQILDIKDVPNMRATVAYLRAKADKLESQKGRDEKREELQKAVDAYADVMAGIDSEKYKPNHYGEEVYKEARQRLGIGEYEYGTTYGMALRRDVVATRNPFQRFAIARYEYFELVYEHQAELTKFAIAGLLTIASFLLPGVAAAVLFVVDAGYGIYQGYQGKKQAQAMLDLARLDTDLDIQGVTVEQAEKALHDAKMAMYIAIALAAVVPAFMIVRGVYRGIQAERMLGKLAETNPSLAAKIVDGAGGTKMAGKLLIHFAGDGEKVLKALDLAKDGKSLNGIITKVKDAELALRLLHRAGGEEGLRPLLSRFKNYAHLDEQLGKVGSAERLTTIFDLAKGEKNVARLLDVMSGARAEKFLTGGLSTEQALVLHAMPDSVARNYLKLLETGDPALREGMRDLMRLTPQGKLESRVVQETLEKTAEFMSTTKRAAGADYVKRFENIAQDEQKLAEARNELNRIKDAKGDTTVAQASVDRLTERMAQTREANYPGKIRPVDVTPEELKANPILQRQLYEECTGVLGRQGAMAKATLRRLGINEDLVYNQLKRADFREFTEGVLDKMMDRNRYRNVSEMDDMVRGRFDLESREQVEAVVAELSKDPTFFDLASGPRKAKGIPAVTEGYPRYHVIMKDPVTGITHEWQVGTKATTRVFEAPAKEIAPIAIPEALEEPMRARRMKANIHDIEYDIFGAIQNSKKPANQQLARELHIPEFRTKVAELASETGGFGAPMDPKVLDARITSLHQEASVILDKLYQRKGVDFIVGFFH